MVISSCISLFKFLTNGLLASGSLSKIYVVAVIYMRAYYNFDQSQSRKLFLEKVKKTLVNKPDLIYLINNIFKKEHTQIQAKIMYTRSIKKYTQHKN